MFAVRQWPGNGADLDFRGVLEGCTAAIVAAAPIEGTLLNDEDYNGKKGMHSVAAREAFLESDEYAAVAKVLPFCRLWCVRVGWHLPPLCDLSTAQRYPSINLARSPAHPPPINQPRHLYTPHLPPPIHSLLHTTASPNPPTPTHYLPIPGAWWRWRRCWRWRSR